MKSILTIAFLIFSITVFAQNYKKISIQISNPNDFIVLSQIGIDLEHSGISKDNNLISFVNENELNKITSLGFSYTVLIDDWYNYYNSIQKLSDDEKQNVITESKFNFNVDGFGFG